MEDTPANRSHLMDLPNEMLQLIIIRMARRDQVSFRRVCRHIYDLTIQVLYHSIVTQRRTAKDINSFIHSFVTRPQIIHFVQELTIDEVDPVAIRRLLSIPFPELKKLSIKQTDQWPRTVINEAEKAALNGSIKRQPKLKDFLLSAGIARQRAYPLTNNDVPLFDHPTVTRLTLHCFDFTSWIKLPLSTFAHTHLDTLCMRHCINPPRVLELFTSPTTHLLHFRLHCRDSRRPGVDLVKVLRPFSQTLKTMKLFSCHERLASPELGLRSFKSLIYLQLFASDLYNLWSQSPDKDDASCLDDMQSVLRSSLPPNLEVFGIEGLLLGCCPSSRTLASPTTAVNADDNTSTTDSTVPPRPSRCRLGFFGKSIVRALLLHHDSLCPRLRVVYSNYVYLKNTEGAANVNGQTGIGGSHDAQSDDLFELAQRKGVDVVRVGYELPFKYNSEYEGPIVEWIDTKSSPGINGANIAKAQNHTGSGDKRRLRLRRGEEKKFCRCYSHWVAWDGHDCTCRPEDLYLVAVDT